MLLWSCSHWYRRWEGLLQRGDGRWWGGNWDGSVVGRGGRGGTGVRGSEGGGARVDGGGGGEGGPS